MNLRTPRDARKDRPPVAGPARTAAADLDEIARISAGVIATTTATLEGYRIVRYLEIDYAEVTVNFRSAVGVVIDPNLPLEKQKLQFDSPAGHLKRTLLDVLCYKAHLRGGNAVVGVTLTSTLLPEGLVRLEATGTAVIVE